MRFSNLLLGSLIIACAATACDENNVGSSILDSNSYLVVDSTFTISGLSEDNTRIQKRKTKKFLGRLNSDEYGDFQSDFVTEFMPVSNIDTTGVSATDIDSIKMQMVIPMGGYTGDSITPMRVNVYKLNKNLPEVLYSDFDPSQYYSTGDLLGSTSYTMTMLGQTDSLYYTSSSSYSSQTIYYRTVFVKFPKSLGQELFQMYKTNPEVYANSNEFVNHFPGIYATTSYGNGRVINIASTQINLYYSKHGTTSEGNDTIMPRVGQYYGVSPQVLTNNNIRIQPSENIKSLIADGNVIVQAPAGYNAHITLPTKKIVDRYYELSNSGLTVLNDITLSIPASKIANDKKIEVPQYLLLVKSSEKEKFFSDFDVNDNTNTFYASYNSSTKSYSFSIREFIKQFLDSKTAPTDEDESLVLIPVDMTFETQSSYYSSTQVVTSITPQVSTLAMAKLDLDNAKITVTFSKKDFSE